MPADDTTDELRRLGVGISVDDVAQVLGISRSTAYELAGERLRRVNAGEAIRPGDPDVLPIPVARYRKALRCRLNDLTAYVESLSPLSESA